jgi:site-specific DNA recombinase
MSNKTKDVYVKDVAIYLRKSRGETEQDLLNQRNELIEICKSNNWTHYEYEEIVSGDTVEMRPMIQELLYDIEDDLFDAVMVIETDRLGRGKSADMEHIKEVLVNSKTLLCERGKLLDLSTDQDEFVYDMRTFIARQEYLIIKRRLRRGKIQNAKRGLWSNGKPPLPYTYNKEKKMLCIDPVHLITYKHIIDAIVKYKKNLNQIAHELNNLGLKTAAKKGLGLWSDKTVRDTVLDITHLGKIVIGKSKGNGHKKKPKDAKGVEMIDPKDWKIYDGLHEAVKTQEEHDYIVMHLARHTKMVKRSTAKETYPLTKILKCGFCGHFLGFQQRQERQLEVRKCWYTDPYGVKCGNKSASMVSINEAVKKAVQEQITDVELKISGVDTARIENLNSKVQELKKGVKATERALVKEQEAYQADIYTVEEYKVIVLKLKGTITVLNNEIAAIQTEIKFLEEAASPEKLNVLLEFKQLMDNPDLTYEMQNELWMALN